MPTIDLPPAQSDGPGNIVYASLFNRIRTAISTVNTAVDSAASTLSSLATTVSGKADASHTHAASAITSGLIAAARLGSGTASSTTFLTGAQTYATPVAANGLPPGGTAGQTVVKGSSTNYDAAWGTPSTSGTISDASTTTKGVVQLTNELGGTATAPTVPGLALKAPIASPTFTGTVAGVSKSMVGLGSVDNTADLDKPISTLTQTQLNQKAPLARGVPAGGAAGQAVVKTSTSDYVTGYLTVEAFNVAVSGTYPTRPSAAYVCWVGPDPGSLASAGDSWREV